MKKDFSCCIMVMSFLLCTIVTVDKANAVPKEVNGAIGTFYAKDPSKFGLDVSIRYGWILDKYFNTSLESGLLLLTWEKKIGEKNQGGTTVDVKADTNAYAIPILINAQIRLQNLRNKMYVVPFITVGLGYTCMVLHYSQPSFVDSIGTVYKKETITKFFSGLTWGLLGGVSLKPASDSKVEVYAEVGYRNAPLQSKDLELDLSGIVFRLGVRYPL